LRDRARQFVRSRANRHLKNFAVSRPQGRNADFSSNWITSEWPTIWE
jgi:hypothetical protein